jgi:hypothetical protein
MTTQTQDIGAAASREFVVGYQFADENPLPVTRPQGGQKIDRTWPDGIGKPSDTQAPDTRPSNQLNNIPKGFPKRRK